MASESNHRPKSRGQARDGGAETPEDLARDFGFHLIAGVDEAGRGPWAGPVVAAAVVLPACLASLGAGRKHRALGVRIDDSKRLSPLQRRDAFHVILQHAMVGIGIVPPEAIDAHNILEASLCAMEKAVADLSCLPEVVLVDGNRAPQLSIPCWPIVEGDRTSFTIASASIVAKVIRDSLMTFYHRLFPAYRFDKHKGYGTALHYKMLTRHGPSSLHRLSFKPVSMVARRQWPLDRLETPQDHDPTTCLGLPEAAHLPR